MRDDLRGSTDEWVEKLHDTQKKDEINRKHQGDGHPDKKLPAKQHRNGN
ncbi:MULTISPECIES: DUF4023 domain-containing protein [unclassified Paenibacillus]|nr:MULTISPECIES: DUF4023 domain-containing protein [unclassified Paenibacillus]MBP1155903.1 hypothetical protein [Paenibacillus sp. PvP091]MBP1168711.1 hypothetical protein [Paenibacillus sp. PvR098]MBP2439739.1 hypothetical protein [Paenibacillus sp. PvP052]